MVGSISSYPAQLIVKNKYGFIKLGYANWDWDILRHKFVKGVDAEIHRDSISHNVLRLRIFKSEKIGGQLEKSCQGWYLLECLANHWTEVNDRLDYICSVMAHSLENISQQQ